MKFLGNVQLSLQNWQFVVLNLEPLKEVDQYISQFDCTKGLNSFISLHRKLSLLIIWKLQTYTNADIFFSFFSYPSKIITLQDYKKQVDFFETSTFEIKLIFHSKDQAEIKNPLPGITCRHQLFQIHICFPIYTRSGQSYIAHYINA